MIRTPWVRGLVVVAAVLVLVSATTIDTIVRPPKFDYKMTTLPNGLQVVMLEDHSTPVTHVAVWYHVGSKDEKRGRTGFAHLFEHLMFKGSKNVRPDQHPSWITSIGGEANAETDEDSTIYWQTVPSHHLPLVLWLEADRMASLEVSDDKFRTEREVVKEERRMRFENQPFGRLSEIIFDKAFKVHPYKHQTIGSLEDLEAASINDVREFHRTYYVPNNATVVIVGDFDSAEALKLVQQYMGRVPRGRDVPRDIPREPPHQGPERVTVTEAWPLPAVVVAYHITYDGHPDAYPLHILAKILSDGDSSRLYQSLVYEKQMALAAFGEAKLIEHPNLFFSVAIVQPGQNCSASSTASRPKG
jgi:zinc protease